MPEAAGPAPADSDAADPEVEQRRLLDRFADGHRAALARAISMVEDEASGFQNLLDSVLRAAKPPAPEPVTRERATHRIGITGPPGAGKSTLVAALTARYRESDETVGIVAVDPTSPFSGGALLGDRIRMRDLATDAGVFIRSMATRSGSGGLATTTGEVTDLMDAFGFDRILVETVGVGQTELEIAGAADTVVVVLVPESGDMVQAMKAGLMEIADIFVVNKADRPGADAVIRDLRQALDLRAPAGSGARGAIGSSGGHGSSGGRGSDGGSTSDGEGLEVEARETPVIRTVASSGEGVEALREAIDAHARWLRETGEGEHRMLDRARSRIRAVVERELRRRVWSDEATRDLVDSGARSVRRGEETPYSVARRVMDAWKDGSRDA